MSNRKVSLSLATALVGLAVAASSASADMASTIEGYPTNTAVTYDNASGAYPVVTAVLTQAGAVSGTHTYSTTALLAQDSSGSIDIYGSQITGYTPTVGDAISVTGTYSPFHQLPEIVNSSTYGTLGITPISSGNTVPSPLLLTVPQANVTTLGVGIAGYLIQIDNVTISGGSAYSSVFPTYANGNVAYTITDGSSNSMEYYDYVTSYSTSAAFGGQAVPTGPVDLVGFMEVYPTPSPGIPEFTALEILPAGASAPEPTSLLLCGMGLLAMFVLARRRAKAAVRIAA